MVEFKLYIKVDGPYYAYSKFTYLETELIGESHVMD